MKSNSQIFHPDFQVKPFWWEAYQPGDFPICDVPKHISVLIIGAGYSGLSCALELNKLGIESCVMESNEPGYGASTRSGGLITASGGIKTPLLSPDHSSKAFDAMIAAANDGIKLVEKLIAQYSINCEWRKTGFLKLANTKKHLQAMEKKSRQLNQYKDIDSRLLSEAQLHDQIGSTYYRGGMFTVQAAHLHPALYYQGLLQACQDRQIRICKQSEVIRIRKTDNTWLIKSKRGETKAENVVIATNGYTGDVTPPFKLRVIPLKPYIIATEVLSDDLAHSLSPQNLSFAETRRIAPFFRLSGRTGEQRMIFGSRVKWKDIEADEMAPLLYKLMIDRYPQLTQTKITHAWSGNVALTIDEQMHAGELQGFYYALGCNGSGVANMTYLGTQVARKVAQADDYNCVYDNDKFPISKFYDGRQRWFIPIIGNYLQLRDWCDKVLDKINK